MLETCGRGTAGRVAELVLGQHRLAYLGHAVSGTLDVDRCDYLLRDSHMTGVRYGIYDLDWLCARSRWATSADATGVLKPVLAIEGRKGLPPIEGFFLARNFMYQQVYHHKAVRAAEVLVRAILARAAELIREGHGFGSLPRALAVRAPAERPPPWATTSRSTTPLSHTPSPAFSTSVTRCSRISPAASSLASLPKTFPLPDSPDAEPLWQRCHVIAADIAARHGLRPDLYVWLDVPSDVPYAEPQVGADGALWVALRHRPMALLGDVSFLLEQLRNKRTVRPRLVFPGELRDEIAAALEPILAEAL